MWGFVALALLLTGCDRVFGLLPVEGAEVGDVRDIGDGDVSTGFPDGGVTCGVSPSFETWQYAAATFAFNYPDAIKALAFYQLGLEQRAIVATAASDGLFDVAADGAAVRLTSLDPPGNAFVNAPGMSPDGAVLWFQQTGVSAGVFYATRASGWVKRRADLGFVDAESIEPGSVGYFGGRARMVITVRNVGAEATLYEIESSDGVTWTMLDTVQLPDMSFNPHLSGDGCYLLFSHQASFVEIHVARRNATGSFTSSVRVVPTSLTTAANRPALTTDAGALWFLCNGALCRGQP